MREQIVGLAAAAAEILDLQKQEEELRTRRKMTGKNVRFLPEQPALLPQFIDEDIAPLNIRKQEIREERIRLRRGFDALFAGLKDELPKLIGRI